MTDIATRVYNHAWKIDPIVRSVIDTDFYKFLMVQMILRRHADVRARFSLINRTENVPLARLIDEGELREQLDHVRTLSLTRGEATWLRGNSFYNERWMFGPEFMTWLEEFRFPDYELRRVGDQYELAFEGRWVEAMMWEIPALAIITELRSRAMLKDMGKFALQVLYARAMTRLWEKIERLRALEGLAVADFGARRRHSYLWQDWCVQAMREGLGSGFLGTSNCLIAMRREMEAIGTNAHELPMIYAALAEDDEALRAAPYRVADDWRRTYSENLRIFLPDTFGTAGYLERAPDWLAGWTGARVDSGDPFTVGEQLIEWWRSRGEDPTRKRLIFSDGLDVGEIERIHRHYRGRVRVGFGWGTLLTNDFRTLGDDHRLAPFSLVCKVVSADGRPTVKLSDNPTKSTGSPDEIARYRRVFGAPAGPARPVEV
ncbi:MAG: nicotinate phosphoribosyltransferase [Pseudomonadota bacterium]